jgi:hypothetical protein
MCSLLVIVTTITSTSATKHQICQHLSNATSNFPMVNNLITQPGKPMSNLINYAFWTAHSSHEILI